MSEYQKADFGKPAEFVMRACERCKELEERLAETEARCVAAEDALQNLYDLENSRSVTFFSAPWAKAMDTAGEVLRKRGVRNDRIAELQQRLAAVLAECDEKSSQLRAANATACELAVQLTAAERQVDSIAKQNEEFCNQLVAAEAHRDEARDAARWLYDHGTWGNDVAESAQHLPWLAEPSGNPGELGASDG
jgi:chromosome segregation ATPase